MKIAIILLIILLIIFLFETAVGRWLNAAPKPEGFKGREFFYSLRDKILNKKAS
ncbi:hypothetical protein [Bacillus massiliglaciei]|uniref:hypothetical protein n=1 Tax=Bacillus massiliglaciei TaxID=1816693 RepID=UPI0018FE206C|nr:hypothetical protein [Bacillus massiliglaciei]